jgi:hypothetical protein
MDDTRGLFCEGEADRIDEDKSKPPAPASTPNERWRLLSFVQQEASSFVRKTLPT